MQMINPHKFTKSSEHNNTESQKVINIKKANDVNNYVMPIFNASAPDFRKSIFSDSSFFAIFTVLFDNDCKN